MSEKPNPRKWKTRNSHPAKSTDEDRLCGRKIKSGIIYKLIMSIGLLAIICTFAIPNPKDQTKKDIHKVATAPLSQINSSELAIILNNQNADMNNHAEISDKEIKGKIVEWELEVLVVASLPDHYKILTKPTSNYPGTFLTLYPGNTQQMAYIENLKPGIVIKIKGKIAGILQGRIRINPALLI